MPCGCVNPKYATKFVGWKDGALIKGAPSLPQGWIQENFIEEASLPHWELVEPLPAIKKVPEPTLEESVYEEVKELDADGADTAPEVLAEIPDIEEVPIQEDVDEALDEFKDEEAEEPEEVVEKIDLMTVKRLKAFIEDRGGKVDRKWKKADLVEAARKLQEFLTKEAKEHTLAAGEPDEITEIPE